MDNTVIWRNKYEALKLKHEKIIKQKQYKNDLLEIKNNYLQEFIDLSESVEKLGSIGSWQYSIVNDTVIWSDQTYRIFDIDPKDVQISFDVWSSLIFPEDKQMVLNAYQKSLEDKIPYELEHRIVTSKGKLRYVKTRGITTFSTNGRPLKSFGISMDITELKEKQLLLKSISITKDKLIGILAHDLRAPFNKIVGFTELLLDNVKDEKNIYYLEIIKNSSFKTLKLLDNLLEWVGNHDENINCRPSNHSVNEVIEEVLSLERLLAKSKRVCISFEKTKDFNIFADKNMLSLILRNIINNAVKFSPRNSDIVLKVKQEETLTQFIITDHGIGISENKKDNIFTKPVTSKTLGTDQEVGYGCGLAICKEFVERHGGEIWAEANKEIGSIFTFTIPKKLHNKSNNKKYKSYEEN
jgi:signal transduction histidine kinase